MANPFDQFDSAAPQLPARSVAAPVTEQPTAGNPFDQFDAPKPKVSRPDDLAGQFGAGVVKALPNAVTGTADLLETGVVNNALGKDPNTGRSSFDTMVNAWGDLLSGKNPGERYKKEMETSTGYKPVSGGLIRSGLDAAKLNPDDYFRAPETPGERIAEMAGEGAGLAVLSPNKAQGWAKLLQLGSEIGAGAASGAGAQVAMEVAPDWLDPLAGLAGGVAGGVGAMGAGSALRGVGKQVGRAAEYAAPAFAGEKGVKALAGQRLNEFFEDPQSTIKALNEAPELVEGSRPTAFQATGDVRLGTLERVFSRTDDAFKAKLNERLQQQNEARLRALDTMQESGNPSLVGDFFRGRMRELESVADDMYNMASAKAKFARDQFGDATAAEVGTKARSAMEAELKRLNTEASSLWKAIDPDEKLVVATAPLVRNTAEIYGRMSPEEMLSLAPSEKNIAGVIGAYGDTLPFQRFKSLRTELNRAMGEAKLGGNNLAYGRLTRLRNAIEESLSESISNQMQANPTLAQEFVRKAREWYDNQTADASGARATAGVGARPEQPAPAATGASQTRSPESGEPGRTTGAEGLFKNAERGARPETVAPTPAPSVPSFIDEATADRFKQASAATKGLKETFSAKPVKAILRRPGTTLPYEMSPEKVADAVFRSGAEGAANIKAIRRAGGNGAAINDAIEGGAVFSAMRAASKDGVIDPAKLASWRAKHSDALKELPALDAKLSDAAKAAQTMADIAEKRAKAIEQVRRTAVGKLLGVEHEADIAATIGAMLGRSDSVRSMRQLASEAKKSPEAMDGLRRAVVDYMLSRLKTPKDALRSDTFQRFIGKNSPALSQVLTEQQISSLRAIAQDLKRAAKDTRAAGGGSDTAENLAAAAKYAHEKPSIAHILFRQALGSTATTAATHYIFGPIAGVVSGLAQTLGGTVLQSMREAGISRIDQLIKEAVLDPELMSALMMKAPKKPDVGSAATLRRRLQDIAAFNMAFNIATGQDEQEAKP